jgi:hypothetical protein
MAFFLLYKALDSPRLVEYRALLLTLDITLNPFILKIFTIHKVRRL